MFININQLKSFYLAAKKKSVTMAAQELMVTPPAVSIQVRQLEKTLGARLMYREGNRLRLTDVGQTLFRRTDKVFREIQEIEKYINEISQHHSGELQIGCPQTPAKYLMPGLISKFNESYPDIRIILTIGPHTSIDTEIVGQENRPGLGQISKGGKENQDKTDRKRRRLSGGRSR